MITVDELRKNIEALPPDAYERMNYYDRWVTSITQTLIQRGRDHHRGAGAQDGANQWSRLSSSRASG